MLIKRQNYLTKEKCEPCSVNLLIYVNFKTNEIKQFPKILLENVNKKNFSKLFQLCENNI